MYLVLHLHSVCLPAVLVWYSEFITLVCGGRIDHTGVWGRLYLGSPQLFFIALISLLIWYFVLIFR